MFDVSVTEMTSPECSSDELSGLLNALILDAVLNPGFHSTTDEESVKIF